MAIPSDIDKQIHDRAVQLLGGEAEYQKIAAEESRLIAAVAQATNELAPSSDA